MTEDELLPSVEAARRQFDDEEPTVVRAYSDPPPPVAEAPVPHVEETQKIRPEQIDRRALPFKKQGRGRRIGEGHPAETGAMRPVMQSQPPLPFQPTPTPPPAGSPEEQVSKWSNEQQPSALDAARLPSALAPSIMRTAVNAAPDDGGFGLAQWAIVGVAFLLGMGVVLALLW